MAEIMGIVANCGNGRQCWHGGQKSSEGQIVEYIWIFEYSNIALWISNIWIRILSLDQTNIFGYLICNFDISEYIWIFDSQTL